MVMTRSQYRAAEQKTIPIPTTYKEPEPATACTVESLQQELEQLQLTQPPPARPDRRTPFDYMIEQGKRWNPTDMFIDSRIPIRKPTSGRGLVRQSSLTSFPKKSYYDDLRRWKDASPYQRRRHNSYILYLEDGISTRTYYFPYGIGCDQRNVTLTMNIYYHPRRLRGQTYDVTLTYEYDGITNNLPLTTDKITVTEILHYVYSQFNVRKEGGSNTVRRCTPLYITSETFDRLLRVPSSGITRDDLIKIFG